MILKTKKLNPEARLPTYGHVGDAGLDLYTTDTISVQPGERVIMSTGIAVAIPEGYVGLIWDKSGLAVKSGITVLAGVIDATYRGEIKVALLNTGKEVHEFSAGDKIAQMLIQNFESVTVEEGELDETERGANNFGSTGVR